MSAPDFLLENPPGLEPAACNQSPQNTRQPSVLLGLQAVAFPALPRPAKPGGTTGWGPGHSACCLVVAFHERALGSSICHLRETASLGQVENGGREHWGPCHSILVSKGHPVAAQSGRPKAITTGLWIEQVNGRTITLYTPKKSDCCFPI